MSHYTISNGLVGGYLPNTAYCIESQHAASAWVDEVDRCTDDACDYALEECDCEACSALPLARSIVADGDWTQGARVMVDEWSAVTIAPCDCEPYACRFCGEESLPQDEENYCQHCGAMIDGR